jgi:hypothetical protein
VVTQRDSNKSQFVRCGNSPGKRFGALVAHAARETMAGSLDRGQVTDRNDEFRRIAGN